MAGLLDQLNHDYVSYIKKIDDVAEFGPCAVNIFDDETIVERNATYEVQDDLPGFASIGNEGANLHFFMMLDRTVEVFMGYLGDKENELVHVSSDVFTWIEGGCRYPDDWGPED